MQRNDSGDSQYSDLVEVRTEPCRPESPKLVVHSDEHCTTILWTPVVDNGHPVISYEVVVWPIAAAEDRQEHTVTASVVRQAQFDLKLLKGMKALPWGSEVD